jgi:hypothetical protein
VEAPLQRLNWRRKARCRLQLAWRFTTSCCKSSQTQGNEGRTPYIKCRSSCHYPFGRQLAWTGHTSPLHIDEHDGACQAWFRSGHFRQSREGGSDRIWGEFGGSGASHDLPARAATLDRIGDELGCVTLWGLSRRRLNSSYKAALHDGCMASDMVPSIKCVCRAGQPECCSYTAERRQNVPSRQATDCWSMSG